MCMMSANRFPFYWNSNPDWYDFDENDQPYLTDKAPEMARKSFEEYKKIQDKYKD